MASLALVVSIIFLFVLLIGPLTYLLSRVGCPSLVIYLSSIVSISIGLWFCLTGIPIWYIGLIPIYCGYLSIKRVQAKNLKKTNETGVDNR